MTAQSRAARIVILRDLRTVGCEKQHDTVEGFRAQIDRDNVPTAALERILRALGDQ